MSKRIRQGQTRWLLHHYPPEYTENGDWLFYASKAFITKSVLVMNDKTGKPFNHLHVYLEGCGHYFWGENGFLQRTYKNKGECIKKAKRIVSHIDWMYDNGYTNSEVNSWVDNVIMDKEK